MKCGFKPILKNSHQINYKSRVVEVTCARSSALSLGVHSFDFHPSVKGNGKLEGNGPIDSRAKVMMSDKKCGPVYLKSETIIDTYARCIGFNSQNKIAMENLLTAI